MYIVFEEKLLVYSFCLQNKWKKIVPKIVIYLNKYDCMGM